MTSSAGGVTGVKWATKYFPTERAGRTFRRESESLSLFQNVELMCPAEHSLVSGLPHVIVEHSFTHKFTLIGASGSVADC